MSIIRSSSKTDRVNSPNRTVSDSGAKVQTSSLIEATISKIRPDGDVILDTPQGLIRTNATIPLEKGDKVLARIATKGDTDVKAHIISRSTETHTLNKLEKFGIELFNKYIAQNTDNNIHNESTFTARVTYVTNNRNTLRYGTIKPGDEISIQMIVLKTMTNDTNAIVGEVLGNSHDSIILNSSIGMLNINAKSNLSMGDKILFRVVGVPDDLERDLIKASIQKIFDDISANEPHLKTLMEAKLNIGDDGYYTRFLQLIASSNTHNATLARLFHNTKSVSPHDVERWIDQDILEPFETSNKSSIFEIISDDIARISKQFIELKIIPDYKTWQTIEMPIPETNQNAKLHLRREKENVIEFTMDLSHDIFGKIFIHGHITLSQNKESLHNLNITFKHSKNLPTELQTIIASGFASHKALSSIDGEIKFEMVE